MERLYKQYRDKADFKVIYIREAHPVDGWRVPANDREGIEVPDPKTEKERETVAQTCAAKLKISIPTLIDGMDNAVEKVYAGWPDRIYIVGKDGRIAYKGKPGPKGFDPKEAEKALKKLVK